MQENVKEQKIDLITVSSRGQLSIPSQIRKELKIEKGTKLLVMYSKDNILLKKIRPSIFEKSLEDVLLPIWKKTEKKRITEKDIQKEIEAYRKEKRKK